MKKVTLLLISILTFLMFISCGSKPDPETAKEPEAPVVTEEAVVEEDASDVDNESLIKKVENARTLAIEAGADKYAPEMFAKVEEMYKKLQENSDGKNKTALYADLEKRYSILADYAKAKSTKEKVDSEYLSTYAEATYAEGVILLKAVEVAFRNDAAFDDELASVAKNAYIKFNKVYLIAYKMIAQNERSLAFDAKKDADSVKASVSQKDRYKVAADEFSAGDSAYSMQNPESAYNHYAKSKDAFTELYADVYEKRAEAQRIMEEAKKRVEESNTFAAEADTQAPIKEPVEGIEEADAVLLEEDEYEEVEVVEFEETLEDEELKDYELPEEVEELVKDVEAGVIDAADAIQELEDEFVEVEK